MVKRTIKETVREYDTDGKLLKETVTETTEDDDTTYFPPFNPYPYASPSTPSPWWSVEPTCTCDASNHKE